MTIDELQTVGVVLSLAGTVVGIYIQMRKLPGDLHRSQIDASASAAAALKSYSEEVIALRRELAEMRAELRKMEDEREKLREIIEEWQDGIQRLISQIEGQNITPVWVPKRRE